MDEDTNFYPAIGLIGGAEGDLDAIDGEDLIDGAGALVIVDGDAYLYRLDAVSGADELSPYIIAPDINPGTKRWILSPMNINGMSLSGKVYRHFRIGATSWFKKESPPEDDLVGICPVLKFDPDIEEQVYYSEPIPFRLAAGTVITTIIDWCYEDAADAGTVVWGLEFINIATGEIVAGSTTTITGKSEASQNSGIKISTLLDTGITGSVWDDDLVIRLYRNADDGVNDTLLVDACFIKLHLHFIMDKLGEAIS